MNHQLTNLTRRDVLASGVRVAGVGVVAGLTTQLSTNMQSTALAEGKKATVIDAHSHIWTREIEKYPLAKGATLADLAPPSFTTEELLATMATEKVDRCVLIAHTKFYGFDNRYMTDSVKAYPGKFRVVGMVDDAKPHPDMEMKRLLRLGVTGFRIVPGRRGDQWLSNSGMQAMWRCSAETRQAICCLINPANLPEVDRNCKRYPDTPVVIDHFARIGIDGRFGDVELRNLCRLARHKHTSVKISAYYALGKKKPPHLELLPVIKRLYESFGASRLMWASDSPYQLVGENNYSASIALVRDLIDFVTPEERAWLLGGTADKVYFFEI
ncbi:MAG: amidohydrolase family protein [Pirellulaceae bacterium]|jgi:predicted TIM-barrel fold metal-dependent hydrolase|nr:amidohydrolase family protein [Pirellulaceae bacterium]HJN11481.1 amidohydrolase family protein [Pirellulaceae bacterium]